MMEASTALKISQSAVSKRIANLERYYDRRLIERHGRRVVLTHHGTRLVERVTPLLSELRSVFLEDNALRKGKIILGVSEAILASWGPRLFAQVRTRLPGVEFEFHAQRSPVVLDRLRSGEYMVGLCTGTPDADTDLVSEVIRQAVDRYDPDHDAHEVAALADELASSVKRMVLRLDAAEAKIQAFEKEMGDRTALRARALAELETSGDIWPFALPVLEDSAA